MKKKKLNVAQPHSVQLLGYTPLTPAAKQELLKIINSAAQLALSRLGFSMADYNVMLQLEGAADLPGAVCDAVVEKLREITGKYKFAGEQVSPIPDPYPASYSPLAEDFDWQVDELSRLFPALTPSNKRPNIPGLLEDDPLYERVIFVPNWMKRTDVFGTSYDSAVRYVLRMLLGEEVVNSSGLLKSNVFQMGDRSNHCWHELAKDQGNPDMLLVPIQAGRKHSGRSFRCATELLHAKEFGLGVFGCATLLLLDLSRLDAISLHLSCLGDQLISKGGGGRGRECYFSTQKGSLIFTAPSTTEPPFVDLYAGYATAFLS